MLKFIILFNYEVAQRVFTKATKSLSALIRLIRGIRVLLKISIKNQYYHQIYYLYHPQTFTNDENPEFSTLQ